jgi:NAD dependent epimerase/dehydratase family enzyme
MQNLLARSDESYGDRHCFPMPGFMARLVFGEMADALFLSSARVVPRKLQEQGFTFDYPQLESALRHLLQRPA